MIAGTSLRIAALSKTFPGTRALIGVSLSLAPGEVHALVGQNGSGKSTLIKSLAGYHAPDPGAQAELNGVPFALGHAVPDGLRFVHQDLGLVLELSAMDNLALRGGYIRGACGRVRWREQERQTRTMLARFGVELDVRRPLAEATPVQRTVVAIASAMQGWPGGTGVLVLDEPTALLPHEEVERLLAMVRELRRGGASVLYVSHRLDEIFEVADRVTVLRAGRVVATRQVAGVDARELARLMVGEDIDPEYRVDLAARPDQPVVLELRDVTGHRLRGVDLAVRRGEVLGLAGLAGSGAQQLPYAIAGRARFAVTGQIRLPRRSPEWAALSGAASLGIPLVPADRGRDGVIAEFSVRENLTLSVLGGLAPRLRLRHAAERELTQGWTDQLGIVAAGQDTPITTLSGGNQQKVVVARCLALGPELLVLAEPTAGVDIGARVAIYELIAGLSRSGVTVVFSSSDLGDLRAMASRVIVLRGGKVTAELGGAGLSEHALVDAMEGNG